MKLNKDQLLKHKFWILLIVAVPLILAGQFIVLVVVAGDIDADKKKLIGVVDTAIKDAGLSYYSDEDTKRQLDEAAKYQKKEYEVWAKVFERQIPTMFWPKTIESTYPIYTGKFLRELKFLDGGAAPPVPDDEHHLTGKIVDRTRDYIEVQLRGSTKMEKLYAVATEDMKIDGSVSFFDIPKGKDAQFTFQTGWYFNDRLTQPQWSSEYPDGYAAQIRPILDIVDPINEEGEGVVQFKDWLVPKKASELPPQGTRFLRFVSSWKREEDISEEIWMAQEDLWIQRELYHSIRQANDSVGVMVRKDNEKPGMNKVSTFANPYFELSLKLVAVNKVEFTIKNLQNQRQKVDVKFKIRFTEDKSVPDEVIPIEDEPLDPNGSKNGFKDLVGGPVRTGIHRVEQVLTWDTAAVRRIDIISIGSMTDDIALNHRIYPDNVEPLVPKKEDPAAAVDAAANPNPGAPPGPAIVAPPGPRGEGFRGGRGVFGPGIGAGAADSLTTNLLTKNRYCEKPTEQTRRLPVAITLIIDPAHFDRVLTAFSNSRHRFVLTQCLYNRYPLSVRPPIASTDPLNPQAGAGSFTPFRLGGGPRGEGGVGPRPVAPIRPIGPVGPGPGVGGPGGQSGDEEIEANLELNLYGIVTLYQRFPARKLPKTEITEAPKQ